MVKRKRERQKDNFKGYTKLVTVLKSGKLYN